VPGMRPASNFFSLAKYFDFGTHAPLLHVLERVARPPQTATRSRSFMAHSSASKTHRVHALLAEIIDIARQSIRSLRANTTTITDSGWWWWWWWW
jgi:hypothetical protein